MLCKGLRGSREGARGQSAVIFRHLADNLDFDLAILRLSTHKTDDECFGTLNITSSPIASDPRETDARIEDWELSVHVKIG